MVSRSGPCNRDNFSLDAFGVVALVPEPAQALITNSEQDYLSVGSPLARCNSRTSWAAGSTFRRLQAINFLSKVKNEEREIRDKFSESIPYYYFEIAQLLLVECKDEFEEPRQVKSLIEDLFDMRKEKQMRLMKEIEPDTPVLFLSSAGSAEINYVRPSFTSAYAIVHKM